MEVQQLLDTGAGVEEREEEGPVAHLMPSSWDRIEHRADLIGLQIVDRADGAPFGRHREDALAALEVLWGLRRDESRERMNGGQASIPRGDAILPVGFEVIEKGQDVVDAQMVEREGDNVAVVTGGEKAQQQDEGIAIAQHRAGAESTREGEVLREEGAERGRERRGTARCHCPHPPCVGSTSQDAHWSRNRSLAASTVGGKKVR